LRWIVRDAIQLFGDPVARTFDALTHIGRQEAHEGDEAKDGRQNPKQDDSEEAVPNAVGANHESDVDVRASVTSMERRFESPSLHA
jgi:hypothetical protein